MDEFRFAKFLNKMAEERERQDRLKQSGRFQFTLDEPGLSEPQKLAYILEELGEVARNVLARDRLVEDGERGNTELYTELIHVATLSGAWAEGLE